MIALATLRTRWASFAGTFLALSLGVGLITTVLFVLAGSLPRASRMYEQAPILVVSATSDGRGWTAEFADALATRLADLPSVEAAVPDHSFYAQLVLDGQVRGEPSADREGHSWSMTTLAGYALVTGRPPHGDREVALGQGIGARVGDQVSVLTAAGPIRVTVAGLVDGPGIYLDDATAERLAGGVGVIGLVLSPGTGVDGVAAAAQSIVASDGRVLTGSARAELEPPRDRQIRADAASILSTMVSVTTFAAIFVVGSTFAFGIAQRRREFALLRTIGATPGQVRRSVIAEAFLVSALASTAGVGLGFALIGPFHALLIRARLAPSGSPVLTPAWVVAAAIGVGLFVALAGVWSASRRAGKVRPIEALREAVAQRRAMTAGRWVVGVLATGLGVALGWATAAASADAAVTTAVFSAMALIIGLTLLAPVVISPVVWLVMRPLGSGAITVLVREAARSSLRRVASTVAPVIATVGFSALMAGMYTTVHAFDVKEEAQALPAPVVVVPSGTPGLSDAVPGAETSILPTRLFVTAAGGRVARLDADGVTAASPHAAAVVRAGDVTLSGPTMVVIESVADRFGWRVGAEERIGFADGRSERVRVVAVVGDEFVAGDVQVPRDLVRAHDPSALASIIYVHGQSVDRVQKSLAGSGLGARAVAADEFVDDVSAHEWATVRLVFILLIGMAVGYTAIAIANTLMMATADRRREFATLRLSGATVGQVLLVVVTEAVVVVGIGSLLGSVVALIALAGVVSGLRYYIPDTMLVLPIPAILAIVGVCLLLAVVSSVASAWVGLRASSSMAMARD